MELGSFIGGHVARANRNVLVLNALLVLGVMVIGFKSSNYYYNFFFGPFPADTAMLESVKDVSSLQERFVTVTGQKVLDTGIQRIAQTKDKSSGAVTAEEINADYLLLVVGERLLLTEARHGAAHGASFTGSLEPIPYSLHKSIVADLERAEAGAKGKLFPFLLDGGNFRLPGYVGIAVGIVLLALGIWNISKALSRARDGAKSPIVQKVMMCGELCETIPAIDNEVREGLTKFGRRCATTKSWFFKRSLFGLDVAQFEQVVWAYRKITNQSVNAIPAGKLHAVVVHTQFGDQYVVDMSAKHAEQFLNELSLKAPWVICGYTEESKALWDNDTARFCETVEARKSEVMRAH